jgi:hypothetical protein
MIRILGIVVACAWIGFVAYEAMQAWPTMPLDMGGGGPQVRAVYDKAVTNHVIRAALFAGIPAIAVLFLTWLLALRSKG